MKNSDHRLDSYYLKYRTMVIRNAASRLEDKSAAEDIAQEAFIRLGVNLEHVPPEKVKAWLLCVSDRIALDHNRKGGKKKVFVGLSLEEYEKMLSEELDAFFDLSLLAETSEAVEARKFLMRRLQEEKPDWYRVLVMSEFENMDNGTISRLLGVSPLLVSKWKERGRAWLKREYQRRYEEP